MSDITWQAHGSTQGVNIHRHWRQFQFLGNRNSVQVRAGLRLSHHANNDQPKHQGKERVSMSTIKSARAASYLAVRWDKPPCVHWLDHHAHTPEHACCTREEYHAHVPEHAMRDKPPYVLNPGRHAPAQEHACCARAGHHLSLIHI